MEIAVIGLPYLVKFTPSHDPLSKENKTYGGHPLTMWTVEGGGG